MIRYLQNPQLYRAWEVQRGSFCEEAPFIMPTSGYIGYLWHDRFQLRKEHTGLDIFGGGEQGQTLIVAPYDGFLSRKDGWLSTLVLRIPSDPLQKDRQIWVYMTHMADADGNSLIDKAFPPGTTEVAVKAGDLLGYQGNYSGRAGFPVGVHLHISIVMDDGQGNIMNESQIGNTLDPSPYFGMNLDARTAPLGPVSCENKN